MKSAIHDLYLKKGANYEDIKTSAEYKRLVKEFVTLAKDFAKHLTEEQKEIFKELEELQEGMESEIGSTHFIEGFKFGLLLGVEASMRD